MNFSSMALAFDPIRVSATNLQLTIKFNLTTILNGYDNFNHNSHWRPATSTVIVTCLTSNVLKRFVDFSKIEFPKVISTSSIWLQRVEPECVAYHLALYKGHISKGNSISKCKYTFDAFYWLRNSTSKHYEQSWIEVIP